MTNGQSGSRPLSVVIPILNEEEILEQRSLYLVSELKPRYTELEIILAENGSIDRTKDIAQDLANEIEQVVAVIDDRAADYGQALVEGIAAARYDEVVILELDYLDLGFLESAYPLLHQYDLVIGSKKLSPGLDHRPWKRKMLTHLYNSLLRRLLDVKLTETHGLKALRKSCMGRIINDCVTRNAVWPSELCIRAYRDPAIRVKEIPLTMPLREIRSARIQAFKRLSRTINDLALLRVALRDDD